MAPKRARSPPNDLPAAKRTHLNERHDISLTFNTCLSDELVLAIFSYLSATELCRIQTVDAHWARLSNDNFLWKSLFNFDFPSQRLRGARGFSSRWVSEFGPTGGREIKPLPARAKLNENQSFYFPFKWMYRVSRNWRQGRCTVENFPGGKSQAVQECSKMPGTRLLVAGDLIVRAVVDTSGVTGTLLLCPDGQTQLIPSASPVSSMTLDHSATSAVANGTRNARNIHLACFYESTAFEIFSIPPDKPTATLRTHLCHPRRRASPVRSSLYHHPLVIAMSSELELSIWNLDQADSSGLVKAPIHSTRTFSAFPPLSLSLSSASSASKLFITYCMPVYPAHWLPAACELVIDPHGTVSSSRKSKSFIASSNGWATVDEREAMEAEWSRKLGAVKLLETDGKFVVAGGSDNYLQVYRLHSRGDFRLQYLRTLAGHTTQITSLKVADGRCVSTGVDGSLRVWDLESGWDVEVDAPGSSAITDLCFDERRAVGWDAGSDSLRIWRFDL